MMMMSMENNEGMDSMIIEAKRDIKAMLRCGTSSFLHLLVVRVAAVVAPVFVESLCLQYNTVIRILRTLI
uniref:Uncharacterized protein n=1 Tax=Lepeophtheirus salmonis TaxID=72036 RepID=A0A0K2SV80_LEPSM